MPVPDTQADLALLESAVREAGGIARKFFGAGGGFGNATDAGVGDDAFDRFAVRIE